MVVVDSKNVSNPFQGANYLELINCGYIKCKP